MHVRPVMFSDKLLSATQLEFNGASGEGKGVVGVCMQIQHVGPSDESSKHPVSVWQSSASTDVLLHGHEPLSQPEVLPPELH